MKRDMDLVRELLLKLEALPGGPSGILTFSAADPEIAIEGKTDDEIDYHLALIYAAGFVSTSDAGQMLSGGWVFRSLTWEGHDFLDAIRDPDVWKRTKAGASKVGSWSLAMVRDLAAAYAKMRAKELLGLDL